MLLRETNWLDYLNVNWWWSLFAPQRSNMTTEPSDMITQVAALIAGGEGSTVEFKEDIPKEKDQLLKTLAAFANGQGGVLLLGVKDRARELVGIRGMCSR